MGRSANPRRGRGGIRWLRDAINKIIGTEYTRADGTTAFIGFAAGSAWGIGTYDDGEEEEAWEEMEDGDWLEWEVQP